LSDSNSDKTKRPLDSNLWLPIRKVFEHSVQSLRC
jgi:hypothetical protein